MHLVTVTVPAMLKSPPPIPAAPPPPAVSFDILAPSWPVTWFPEMVELIIARVPELNTAPPQPPNVWLLTKEQLKIVKFPRFAIPAPLT